ncbi:MAG: Fe-S cluster assembly protein [Acetothermia bacterium 64_32]|nr:MAG: Fe-S cluster assembly protein [Acetothermia bacterium 64_32]HAF70638.1 hypothetical protein [Candidatus Acetothermia bacterium]
MKKDRGLLKGFAYIKTSFPPCHPGEAEWVRALINPTWERRGEIEPSYKTWAKLTALWVYRHLPKNNRGRCGQLTCMASTLRLVGEGATIQRWV